ncbi:Cof-type HAD-IIB family hydrolase [Candidatus Tachikawaea gelatinosa]|uniref:Cof-like hydrolase n=1 Tax=Candidatus Tachikawaea gelatinosa TaxID=1410383 RepID=A0A090AQE1_9ENTR|nr:Cof-type HAD-IIB family hydrolase [Candidatus Tachikawaea gelatinosa]BAP58567.1 cof-like hydrolase [Candidatus Tachikawaea gelatinosa]
MVFIKLQLMLLLIGFFIMYEVVVFDLDGTLLSPQHSLTLFSKQVIRKIYKNHQIIFVIATGRNYIDVENIKNKINIPIYSITSNGAMIHNTKNQMLFRANLKKNIARDLFTFLYNNNKIFTNIYKNDKWFINDHNFLEKKYFCESHFDYKIFSPEKFSSDGITKIFFTTNHKKKLIILKKKIKDRWKKKINITFSRSNCLDITAKNISKGNSLKMLLNKVLKISLKRCIAFGDGMNDKEMLNIVGKGYIMDNADKNLKKILPHIEKIGSNFEDAVAQTLKKIFY